MKRWTEYFSGLLGAEELERETQKRHVNMINLPEYTEDTTEKDTKDGIRHAQKVKTAGHGSLRPEMFKSRRKSIKIMTTFYKRT